MGDSEMEKARKQAEQMGNNPGLEIEWARKAFHHAETYFKLITAIDPTNLRLTQIDNEIYTEFRKDFPDMKIDHVSEDEMKSVEGKKKWRELLNKFEGKVEDWNMGTLMRADAKGEISESNTVLVPRVQFLAIEIARNREGINKAALHKTAAE